MVKFILCPHKTQTEGLFKPQMSDDVFVDLAVVGDEQEIVTLVLCRTCAAAVKGELFERLLQQAVSDWLKAWR